MNYSMFWYSAFIILIFYIAYIMDNLKKKKPPKNLEKDLKNEGKTQKRPGTRPAC